MANRRRDRRREVRWRQILARQAASGLSVREFCRRQKLTEASFYFWRRTISARDRDADAVVGERSVSVRTGESVQPITEPQALAAFLPVRVSDAAPSLASIAIELVGGRVLRLPETISTERLVALIEALEARSLQTQTATAGTATAAPLAADQRISESMSQRVNASTHPRVAAGTLTRRAAR